MIGRLDYPLFMHETVEANSVSVFPNPSDGVFTFRSGENISSISIYNTLGEVVAVLENVNALQLTISLSGQPQGMYVYRIVDEQGNVQTGEVVKGR